MFTYPNTTSISQRGGLKKRNELMNNINRKFGTDDFQIVEIPADFIKNKTEEEKTGLKVCSMINKNIVDKLYAKSNDPIEINYTLHTDPVFGRLGSNGRCMSKLNWFNPGWVNNFTNHVFNIIDFLELKPYSIEIHPGQSEKGKNNVLTFSKAIKTLHERYHEKYDSEVKIFIENRTKQHIQDGRDIAHFWTYFKKNYPLLTENTGVILDIQQLYTVTKENFEYEFLKIPKECLFGLHIHERHRTPSGEKIPMHIWEFLSEKIIDLIQDNRQFHILPEVHHSKQAEETYKFCKEFLNI